MEATAKYKPNVEIVSDPESLAQRSVELFVADAQKAMEAKDAFYVAISGGHTPKRFFELLGDMPEPEQNVHRIPTEDSDIKVAARRYEESIREAFGLEENQIPEFDLIVLGMGAEGHTGSLFPNSYAPFDKEDLACVVYVLGEDLNRITLTHPVLCAAAHLAVLVAGKEKAGILKKVLTSEPDEVRYPIHALWPILDKVTWLVDKEAAKSL